MDFPWPQIFIWPVTTCTVVVSVCLHAALWMEKGLVKLPLRVDCADVGMDAESVCGHGLSLHAYAWLFQKPAPYTRKPCTLYTRLRILLFKGSARSLYRAQFLLFVAV